jgi:hypothetical protein
VRVTVLARMPSDSRPGVAHVITAVGSGRHRELRCGCEDFTYRTKAEHQCKHLRRFLESLAPPRRRRRR